MSNAAAAGGGDASSPSPSTARAGDAGDASRSPAAALRGGASAGPAAPRPGGIALSLGGTDVPVFLLDGSAVVVRLRVETSARAVLLALRGHLGLQHDAHFRLFEHSAPGAGGVFRALDEEARVSRVVQRWPQESAASGPRRLVFRRAIYVPGSCTEREEEEAATAAAAAAAAEAGGGGGAGAGAAAARSAAAHRLAFWDCVFHYRQSRYRFDVPSVLGLAVLLLQATRGAFDRARDSLQRLRQLVPDLCPAYAVQDMPAEAAPEGGARAGGAYGAPSAAPAAAAVGKLPDGLLLDEWARRILAAYAAGGVRPRVAAQRDFVRACKGNVAYGSEFFFGRQTWEDAATGERVLEERTVCVGPQGVLLLGMQRPLECRFYEYADMKEDKGWDVDASGRIFALALEGDEMVYIVSAQALDVMAALLASVESKVAMEIDRFDASRVPRAADGAGALPLVVAELPPPPPPSAVAGEAVAGALDYCARAAPWVAGAGAAAAASAADAAVAAALAAAAAGAAQRQGQAAAAAAAAAVAPSPLSVVVVASGSGGKGSGRSGGGGGGGGGEGGGPSSGASARGGRLPDGWEEARDVRGDVYYFATDAETGEPISQWERPEWPEENLAEGWEVLQDAEGDAYFWHRASGKTTWDKPRRAHAGGGGKGGGGGESGGRR